MKRLLFLLLIVSITFSCEQNYKTIYKKVSNASELKLAIENAEPGDEIVLANGIYRDIEIEFFGKGTKKNPIVLKAETPGKVSMEGKSNLKMGGEYLEVRDLYFKNGHTPTKQVILFKINDTLFANHSKITNCVIENFTQPDRDVTDHWIEIWGRYNELSNNYISGKSNFGPTVMVMLKGNEHIKNYHQIINNHFGPRPRKGGPHGETMQIGDSGTSMTPSHTNVENNLFERCNGEVEIISSKSNFNTFKNNVFFENEGSLVLRHGNYATVDGNVFIGNDNSDNIGGIRVINTGHWITNNYFYKLKGKVFRAPIAVMNGILKSPQNRYNQVTDAVMAYNTFIDCETPLHFSVGSNVSQSDVLPKSEIRSARPVRTVVANNIIYNEKPFNFPIKNYDKVDGVTFKNNYTNSDNKSEVKPKGLMTSEMETISISEYLTMPTVASNKIYTGFDFETIETDMFGNKRTEKNNKVGAMVNVSTEDEFFKREDYGADWYIGETEKNVSKTIEVSTSKELMKALTDANSGDLISLKAGKYAISETLPITKTITITSGEKTNKAILSFSSENIAFEMNPDGMLHLENISIVGNTSQTAFQTLDKNMSSAHGLWLKNTEVSNFKSVVEVSKGSFADTIMVANSVIKNCANGIKLNKETNDKGDYNAEFLIIKNSTFDNVSKDMINYYRGGYDESTIGGNLIFMGNTVTNCGKNDDDGILINNRGIVNATFSDNTFRDNPTRFTVVLWGGKGQKPKNNIVKNSGEIKVVQNLELKLMY